MQNTDDLDSFGAGAVKDQVVAYGEFVQATIFLTRDTQPRSISQLLAFFLEDAQVVCGCLGIVRSDEIMNLLQVASGQGGEFETGHIQLPRWVFDLEAV